MQTLLATISNYPGDFPAPPTAFIIKLNVLVTHSHVHSTTCTNNVEHPLVTWVTVAAALSTPFSTR